MVERKAPRLNNARNRSHERMKTPPVSSAGFKWQAACTSLHSGLLVVGGLGAYRRTLLDMWLFNATAGEGASWWGPGGGASSTPGLESITTRFSFKF